MSSSTGIVSFPPALTENSYQRLLYDALGRRGFTLVDGHLKAGWLLRNRRRARVLHFHWPQPHWHHAGRFAAAGTAVKLPLFAARLAWARALGYRVAWTIHEVYPLDRGPNRLDRLGGRVLATACGTLLANDEQTAAAARAALGRVAADVTVVPHSSYAGAYPEGRDRAAVREELGIGPDTTVFLLFGHLSVYKRVEFFVDAFRAARVEDAALVVAGKVMHAPTEAAVRAAAAEDPRITPDLGFIPDERVGELFAAADVAISPRMDGGTSGVLLLALSMGRPVITADVPTYTEVTAGERCGWTFPPDDAAGLAAAYERAAGDPAGVAARTAAAAEQVAGRSWDGMAEQIAAALDPARRPAPAPASEPRPQPT